MKLGQLNYKMMMMMMILVVMMMVMDFSILMGVFSFMILEIYRDIYQSFSSIKNKIIELLIILDDKKHEFYFEIFKKPYVSFLE